MKLVLQSEAGSRVIPTKYWCIPSSSLLILYNPLSSYSPRLKEQILLRISAQLLLIVTERGSDKFVMI